MRLFLTSGLAALILAAMPVWAKEGTAPPKDGAEAMDEGARLLSEGMKLLLFGMLQGADDLRLELQGRIIELSDYEFPEILPNGDIIIRRKEPLPVEEVPDEGEIDL